MTHPPTLVALDRVLAASRLTHTGPEAAAEAGVDPAWAGLIWRAAGFDGRFDDRELSSDDVRLLAAADLLVREGQIDEDEVLRLARMFNLAAAPLAEAAAGAINRAEPDIDPGARLAGLDASLDQFEDVLLHTWRRRLMRVLTAGRSVERTEQAVAFVDLVGFTHLVGTDDRWMAILDRLEVIVFDVVAAHGGRVIKTIGDEVMWVHPDAAGMVATCRAVATAIDADPLLPEVRIGAAWGDVVATRGDRFGTPVNLASRLVRRCRPGDILLCPHLTSSEPGLGWTRWRWIRGIGWVRVGQLRRSGPRRRRG